jgi:hypothetical protein
MGGRDKRNTVQSQPGQKNIIETLSKKLSQVRYWCFTPIILATQETD